MGGREAWEEGTNLISFKGFWETFGPHGEVGLNTLGTNEIGAEGGAGGMEKGRGPAPLTVQCLFL